MSDDNVIELYKKALDLSRIDDEACIRCYDEIIQINSNENMAWRGKGLALGRLGESHGAIICFNKALEIDPSDELAQRGKNIELEELNTKNFELEESNTNDIQSSSNFNSISRTICINCGKNNLERAKFCNYCSRELLIKCINCKKENPMDSSFCNLCGFTLP